MQTDNWRHLGDILGGMALCDAGIRGGRGAHSTRPGQSADTRGGGNAHRGFRAEGGRRPKLQLVCVDGRHVSDWP